MWIKRWNFQRNLVRIFLVLSLFCYHNSIKVVARLSFLDLLYLRRRDLRHIFLSNAQNMAELFFCDFNVTCLLHYFTVLFDTNHGDDAYLWVSRHFLIRTWSCRTYISIHTFLYPRVIFQNQLLCCDSSHVQSRCHMFQFLKLQLYYIYQLSHTYITLYYVCELSFFTSVLRVKMDSVSK